ncbi:MAG: hypothetical protein ACP5IZ_11680 [Thermoprotei archaeon]
MDLERHYTMKEASRILGVSVRRIQRRSLRVSRSSSSSILSYPIEILSWMKTWRKT